MARASSRARSRASASAYIAIVDFKPGELPVGPGPDHKIPTNEIIEEMERAGFKLFREDRELLPYQDVLVFELPTLRYFDRGRSGH